MNLVLILRSELICLIILVFLLFTSRFYKIGNESKCFSRLLRFALIHVVFDIVTVITVNNLTTVPALLNWVCHIIFYLSAIFFSNELVNYVTALCYPKHSKKSYAVGHILTLIYILCLPFLKIEYVADNGTNSSSGLAAYVGYGLAFTLFIIALVVIFVNYKVLTPSFKRALIPMMLVLMITEIAQIIWRCVLFTGGAVTIVTVGFFFSLENPVEVFKQKAITDALTGVRSRSSYEEDIKRLDSKFVKSPSDDYIFVFCDLNDLRAVNNRFGHSEGDNYIRLIATSISHCMEHSSAVYRIGGDEFLVYYNKVSEETVKKEIKAVQDACEKASQSLDYVAAVTAGYAKSSSNYKTLKDVVKTADYTMYQNKAAKKSGVTSLGTVLNYTGLTDKIFDAICVSSDRSYPFITNLETNVTRIAPAWKEYFGLNDVFFADFLSVWKDHIHPDYYEGYMADIVSLLNGHQKYHYFDYYAKKADGEYVRVVCHGSVYNDSNGNNYFTGYMDNYGMEENIDDVTELPNFDALTAYNCRMMQNGTTFSLLKLKLNNFARVNMLYGYSGGNEVIKKVAKVLKSNTGDLGHVYCHGAVNFTILFDTDDEQVVRDYYSKVSKLLASGVQTSIGVVPILVSAGAITYSGQNITHEVLRSCLVYALEESHYYRRNNLVFYKAPQDTASSDITLLSDIHTDALADMQYFRLRYQPIVDAATAKTVGAEALLRWNHPTYGEVPPAKFIDFIENDPCYYRLGLMILERAINDAKSLLNKIPGFRINVNITALQLQNENFTDNVCDILSKYDFAPSGLVLELTERCKEMDSRFLSQKIAELRSRGILVAFDDFGTGYSTINLLMDIPVDEIKLDKDFVKDLANRDSYQIFVRSLVYGSTSVANKYTICFEGIETKEMFDMVSSFGDYLAQGYYFAKPLLIDEFNDYISKQ